MNIKLDNMIDLRAFCLEQAIKIKSEYKRAGDNIPWSTTQLAEEYETYILGGVSLPDQPFNSDKLLYDTMTEMIKDKEEEQSSKNRN